MEYSTVDDITPVNSHISLHALLGYSSSEILRLNGAIKSKEHTILIDRGSTYNFIQDRLVKFLGLPITQSSCFNVMVGNGEHLLCNSYCPHVPVCVGHTHSRLTYLSYQ